MVYVVRKQIEEDEREKERVVNIQEKRLREPWKKKYKALIKKFLMLYKTVRSEGRFVGAGTLLELELE
jgi:hypothetical protein